MSIPSSESGVQVPGKILTRQCKATGYAGYFAESSKDLDALSIEDSSEEESENDEDRRFVIQDELEHSEEEYVPQDSSEDDDDDWSLSSDTTYDLDGELDDGYDLSDVSAALEGIIEDVSAAEGQRCTNEGEGEIRSSSTAIRHLNDSLKDLETHRKV